MSSDVDTPPVYMREVARRGDRDAISILVAGCVEGGSEGSYADRVGDGDEGGPRGYLVVCFI